MKDSWKFVSVGSCIKTLIFSLIALSVIFIPISFGTEAGVIFTFKKLPVFGDGSISLLFDNVMNIFAQNVPNVDVSLLNTLRKLFDLSLYAYFIILFLDIIFAIVLIACRHNAVRKLFRVLSAFFAVAMICSALMFLGFVAANVFSVIKGKIFNDMLYTSGILSALGFCIFSFILIVKQFTWFRKPF